MDTKFKIGELITSGGVDGVVVNTFLNPSNGRPEYELALYFVSGTELCIVDDDELTSRENKKVLVFVRNGVLDMVSTNVENLDVIAVIADDGEPSDKEIDAILNSFESELPIVCDIGFQETPQEN